MNKESKSDNDKKFKRETWEQTNRGYKEGCRWRITRRLRIGIGSEKCALAG